MCGLVGLISKNSYGFTKDQQDVFATLLFVDMLRGQDSTGVFVVSNEGDVFVAKDAVNSVDFMGTNEFDSAMRRAFSRGVAMVGHNRKATRGNIVDENAHPFNVDDNIILVHNGTMISDHKKHADVEVDSHAIAHLIHEKGSVSEALSAFSGAYALIWYDVEKGSLNMIRNSQRPLWWMETAASWIWSSEKAMLEFAADRHNLKVITPPTELPVDLHQTYTLRNKSWVVDNSSVEVKPPTYVYEEHGGWQGHRQMFPGYENDPMADWAEDAYGTDRRSRIPQQQATVMQMLPRPQSNHRTIGGTDEPVEFAGRVERERQLARNQNKVVPYQEFNRISDKQIYPWGKVVHVVAFDYDYCNAVDPADGYYLYASPLDNENVIFRKWVSSESYTEELILQISSTGYVYEMTVMTKSWCPLAGKSQDRTTLDPQAPGFLIIKSGQMKLVHRGVDQPVSKTTH
jgi:hypothetical protein